MRRRCASVLLALTIVACNDAPTAMVKGDVVKVTRGDAGLLIENLTDTPRAYSAYDPNWLALAAMNFTLLAVCSTPDQTCLRLPAHGYVVVPYAEVGGYNATTTTGITVMTWRVVETSPGQYEPQMDDGVTLQLDR